ncbi:MAG: lipoprotein-releasing ABC transporter permease subunit [Deltaproteobacteria bacterium]|nr:lipoprotein-releasing ABC transporter permease subunit [Deltaproteobacteria bacterium]NIS78180.1 lipoprotein-releasing ABC transporter permease subunit [Deltaproteobacteria bacterium]
MSSFELFVSLRYLRAKRRQTFISIITVISMAGVALGVFALVVVLSVMSGFEQDLRNRILGTTAHLNILSLKGNFDDYGKVVNRAEDTSGVVSASPYLYSQVLISGRSGASGAILRGVDVKSAKETTGIGKFIKGGKIEDIEDDEGVPSIILGKELSQAIGTFPGDFVEVMVPAGGISPFGPIPEVGKFRVAATFESGMFDFDTGFSFISLANAQKLMLSGDTVSGVEVKVDDIYKADSIAAQIQEKLGFPFVARDWMRSNRNLFSALKLEKAVMFIILVLIVFVAAFNIVSTLIMVVMEKTRDIAVLMSMGVKRDSIKKIFAMEGLIIGFVGTALGLLLGYIGCLLLDKYQFIHLPSDVYYISTLPVNMDPLTFIVIGISAITICYVATIYPAKQASKIDPAEALRYE